jgi:hypothetical protein
MVPFPILPDTRSAAERKLYEAFLEQLDEEYVVFHSVDWVLAGQEQGEADFVVAHPEDGLLVIEAKGGRLSYDPRTRRWSQTGRDGTHRLGEDPFHQAEDEMRSLVHILESQPGWDRWKPSYGWAVAFPDGTYDESAHPGAPVEHAIDRGDMDRLDARIREIQRSFRKPGRRFGAEGIDALSFALGHRIEIRAPLRLRFDEEDRTIVELTQEQSFIRAWVVHRRRAAVTGPAGCGKTMLAIEVAIHLAAKGNDVLLTCFNKGLVGHLRRSTDSVSGLRVANFHTLCVDLAREAGIAVPEPTGGDDRELYDHRLPELLEEAARRLGPRFDVIVVDEAQDFRPWWWAALLSLHRDPDEGMLYLFADDNQNLYGGGDLPIAEEDRLPPLPANLRNTRRIHEFVSVFYDADRKPAGRGPQGTPVQVLDYTDEASLERLVGLVVTNLVQAEGVPLEDIVLLTPAGRGKSILRSLGRVGDVELTDEPVEGKLLWSSVHAFKGLERPVVILAELGERHEEDVDRYLYVGGSRARNHLIVVARERVAARLRRLPAVAAP